MKNILILNAGTRNKLVRYFKQTLQAQADVIATDSYILAPAVYEADRYYITKRWDEPGYWDDVLELCQKEQIGLVLSLVDPELQELAHYKPLLEKRGILVNTGTEQTVRNCFDKYRVLEFLRENGYPYIRTYTELEKVREDLKNKEISFPLFVKPRCGSGSIGIERVDNMERLEMLFGTGADILVQEFVDAQELGVDVYVDLITGKVTSVFAKKKLKMRAGETDKSVSYKNKALFELVIRFAEQFGLRGTNDMDVFERDGQFYISEVNPRFGGGYLHAYECGENFPQYLINNMRGVPNKICIGNYEPDIYMMKYFDIKMLKMEE